MADGVAKIIALIPAESVAAYQSIYNLTNNGKSPLFNTAVWIIFIGTPLWQLYATKGKGESLAIAQAIISLPAFYIWLVGLQSPFLRLPSSWTPVENAIILIVGTFILPLIAWALNLAVESLSRKGG